MVLRYCCIEVCHETCPENTNHCHLEKPPQAKNGVSAAMGSQPHNGTFPVTARKWTLQLPGAPGTGWVTSAHVHPTLTASWPLSSHNAHRTAPIWNSRASTCVAHSSSETDRMLLLILATAIQRIFSPPNDHCSVVHKQTQISDGDC